MENTVIITYSLAGKKNALEITRKIYGYTDSSNYGSYKYQRKGLLTDIPYEKLAKGCLLTNKKYETQILKALTSLGLKVKVLTVHIVNRH